MQTLDKTLRGQLEQTVRQARIIAEAAAKAALEQLGVGEKEAFSHLSDADKNLRRKLRAHGLQLGDTPAPDGSQSMELLIEEVAYEHWHRMLFARFLAENNLLMYRDEEDEEDDELIPVSLNYCEEVGNESGESRWSVAARYAACMLPQIFQLESPVFGLTLAPEHQNRLEDLVAGLDTDVFRASDSLGWVYQFWQSDSKDRINKSEVKIGSRELPAVTQLFTEPYMVQFLLDNSLGAWWAARHLSEEDLKQAQSEEELRRKAAIPGVPLEYLRFVKDEQGHWAPAAGTFADWPKTLAKFKLLDPCCGSGHFLVAALQMLTPMRMHEEEKLRGKPVQALCSVLEHNLHGLELDLRCVKLAAFALAFAAWTYQAGETEQEPAYFNLPQLNIACSGLPITTSEEQWTALASEHTSLRNALALLHEEFQKAPILGSLLSPSSGIVKNLADVADLQALLAQTLSTEKDDGKKVFGQEAAVVARGLAKATAILNASYTLVITNVPYLARGKQNKILREFCEENYPNSKNDIATVFLERCLQLCSAGGTTSVVMPQNWLFLKTYTKLRIKLLENKLFNIISRLGPRAFETISGEIVKAILLIITNNKNNTIFNLINENRKYNLFYGLDVSEYITPEQKSYYIKEATLKNIIQKNQIKNPNSIISFDDISGILLSKYANAYQGISPADFPRFGRFFWEFFKINYCYWCFWQSTTPTTQIFSGRKLILNIEEVTIKADTEGTAYIRGEYAWGRKSIVISAMGNLPVCLGSGEPSDTNVAVLVPEEQKNLPAIWCFCSSPEYNKSVRKIDQKLNVTNATLAKVPFDLERWQKIAEEKYPNGLPKPYGNDPTQWIFHGHPCKSVVWDESTHATRKGDLRIDETVLHVAVARLLGYQWPAELDEDMELDDHQRDLIIDCGELFEFADEDGIVCIPAVRNEGIASDRLLNLLEKAYEGSWSTAILDRLLDSVGCAGKDLNFWLREKFFAQHCKLFQNRPFIWHIWDGLKDGFGALVNYHTLTYKNLETLTYAYLGDWIERQKEALESKQEGAQERLDAAESLQKKLELILAGEAPYDIFVRWKPLEEQPIGWNPDLDDGVRLNIRPFLSVPSVGRKDAGILRDRPNIKWEKDRGKDLKTSPWYHRFKGERLNDLHLTKAEKNKNSRQAQESLA